MLFSHYNILKMANGQKKSYSNIVEIINYVMTDESNDADSDMDLGESGYDRKSSESDDY